jgi:hypothetical protein
MTDIREETNTQEDAAGVTFVAPAASEAHAELHAELTELHAELNEQAEALKNLPTLPEGSTVVQCMLKKHEETGEFELAIQGVLIGSQEFDPYNPCHRFLAAVCEVLPELMDKIGGTSIERVTGVAANDATVHGDAAQGQ